MQTYTLSDEQVTVIGMMEQLLPFPEDALAAYWRYLGATMGFDPSTAETTGDGEFRAKSLTANEVIALGIGLVIEWDEQLGGGIEGHMARLRDGTVLCWTNDGIFGIYRSQQAFDDGEALISF